MNLLPTNRASLAILSILIGVVGISFNDTFIKQLSGGYPLHQIVFTRSFIGIMIGLVLVKLEGGMHLLKTNQPGQHAFRGALIVVANMTYFLALAAMPLADATALFFVAPLFITLLSIPLLGEKVGILRLGAVAIGFVGVVIMQRPWVDNDSLQVSRLVLLLPIIGALTYALNQLMTRKLGVSAKASVLSVYVQLAFIVVSLGFFVVAGDGRFAGPDVGPSMEFLLRAWVWPLPADRWVFVALGINSALVSYCLSQAYRLGDPATIAPFEYLLLPLSVFWGLTMFGDLPTLEIWIGILLILASGIFVFMRERAKARIIASAKATMRQ